MWKRSIRQNKVFSAIVLFLFLFAAIQFAQPAFLYNPDGSVRTFGVGFKKKTILPIWLLAILLGILCYVAVLWV